MSVKREVDMLRRLPLFRGIDPVRLEVLAFTAQRLHLAAGETLVEADEPAEAGYLIVAGAGVLLGKRPDGTPLASRLDAGDFVAEGALLQAVDHKMTVRAASDMEVLKIGRMQFRRLLDEFPEMAGGLARAATGRLADLAAELGRVRDRVAGAGEKREESDRVE